MQSIVLYDSKHGTTRAAAETIAARLGAGRALSLAEAGSLVQAGRGLASADLVVLGAPFYFGQWSRKAVAFLRREGSKIRPGCLALFTVGTGPDEAAREGALAALPALPPTAARAHLGGSLEGARLNFLERAVVRMVAKSGAPVRRYDPAEAEAFAARLLEAAK